MRTVAMDAKNETDISVDFGVSVVLPAGGCGERFGCHIPKQYSLLMDQPVILHTINAFHRISWIKRIAVVVNKRFIAYMDQLILDNELDKVVVVEGCTTRHRSIYAGVKSLAKGEDMSSVVIIHDAVRPFIDEQVIRRIAVYAKTHGAAGVTRPLVSTVISGDDDRLLRESLDRSRYCASEMPQGFQLSVIKTAYEKSNEHDFDYGTECLLLAMKYTGTRAKLFTGPDNLWKILRDLGDLYRTLVSMKNKGKPLYMSHAIRKQKTVRVQMKFVTCQQNKSLMDAVVSKCKSKKIAVEDSPNPESHWCNSVVFIYSDLCPSAISKNTRCVQTSSDSFCSHEVQLKPCVVHVYEGNSLEQESVLKFTETITEMAEDFPDLLVCGILHFNGPEYNRLSDMVTSLVWNRDSCMSGQTFKIHKRKDKT